MRASAPCLLLAALLLAAPLASAQADASAQEGRVLPLHADGPVWDVAPGAYWLHVVAGPEGALLDVSGLSRTGEIPQRCVPVPQATPGAPPSSDCVDPTRHHLGPTNAFGHRLELGEDAQAPRLALVEGTAHAILARPDLLGPGFQNGSYARREARGEVAPGACVAQHATASTFNFGRVGEAVTLGDVRVSAAGPGLRFAFYDGQLRLVGESEDLAFWSGDLHADRAPAFVQACAPEGAEGNATYVVRMERWAPPEEASRVRAPVPAAGPALAAIVAALAAALAERRARR